MKVSVLLPTLYPKLSERAIASLREHGAEGVELEFIIVSPEPFSDKGGDLVWVKESSPRGNCAANRLALEHATGEFVVCVSDDATYARGWLREALSFYRAHAPADRPYIVGLPIRGLVGTCFGRYYANFPFFRRELLAKYPAVGENFYPEWVSAHWGDVSLSMSVWHHGGEVHCLPVPIVAFQPDRMGAPESPVKLHAFKADTDEFVARWSGKLGEGWPVETFKDFNIDATSKLIEQHTINLPNRAMFMARKTIAETPQGLWVLPTHKRVDRCQRTLDAIAATGCSTPGIVFVNGGEQPEGYKSLRLPQNWSILWHDDDVKVCDMYRWFFKRHPNLDWYGVIADDVVPKTHNWDTRLVNAAGRARVASANDEWQAPRRLHGAAAYGGDLVRALGYLCPPDLQHMFFDDVWETIGRELKVWDVLMDVVTTHEHHAVGKAPKDAAYEQSEKLIASDKVIYQAWFNKRQEDYKRVGALAPVTIRQIPITHLRGKKVLVCTPCHGGMLDWTYTTSLLSTKDHFNAAGIMMDVCFVPGESLISRARNTQVKVFLESGADYLWFMDADMNWSAPDIVRMMAHDKDIVAAAGMRKAWPATFCVNPEGPPVNVDQETGLIKVREVGCGCMIISRRAIEAMMKAYGPTLIYTDLGSGQKIVALFDTSHQPGPVPLETGLYWSEDYTFCQRARAIGLSVWVDPHISLGHIGRQEFKGALFDWMMTESKKAREAEQAKAVPQSQPLRAVQ